ncbi:MAG: DNA helicase RecQ [Rhodobacteraceae bacterium]|nr:DNA helicase RecQ [Paracoccaceae bacterium]
MAAHVQDDPKIGSPPYCLNEPSSGDQEDEQGAAPLFVFADGPRTPGDSSLASALVAEPVPTTPPTLDQARETLRRIWGYDDFRPGQDEIIATILNGKDALAIMPTGGGKSLCYQLPAVLRPGVTLVVSPLIALMQDQVAALRAVGIEAGALTSANDYEENMRVRAALDDGSLKLLYCAPERLALEDTAAMLAAHGQRFGLACLAVDEAHCVAQWGHDFRPDYLSIGAFRKRLQEAGQSIQVAAFTATADAATRAEIVDKLFRAPPMSFIRGFDRPNLRLCFEPKNNPTARIVDYVKARPGQAGIVYCASRKGVEKLADKLASEGVRALPYHAGLPPDVRLANQRAFVNEDGVVMTATIAFGMGVDKPDVRYVVHADLPKTVESYYQEIGRAGRDGAPADTLTLYGFDDMKLRRRQIDESEAPEPRKRADRARLGALLSLAEAPACRRQTLLAYFGETRTEPCGACDLCETPPERFDGTVAAQKALSAIVRTGQRFGVEHLINVLRGEGTDTVVKFGHQTLPTFGVGSDLSRPEWRTIFRQLYAAGMAEVNIAEYGQWCATETGWRVLKGERQVMLRKDIGKKAARSRDRSAPTVVPATDNALFERLKKKRAELARAQNVPAYVIFTDRTLAEIASAKPRTLGALSEVHGVGQAKLQKFGDLVLEVVGVD